MEKSDCGDEFKQDAVARITGQTAPLPRQPRLSDER